MTNDAGRYVLRSRIDETLQTFGHREGNAIIHEVMFRMEQGGSVRDWLDMIETVAIERHPYLRFAQRPLD